MTLGKTLTSLVIDGPTSVQETQGAQYRATAVFSDGTTSLVSSQASWSQPSSYASISSSGYLTTYEEPNTRGFNIQASYTYGGVTKTAQHYILLVNVAPVVVSVDVSGPTEFDENSSQQYVATAYYSDGSSKTRTSSATWSSNKGQIPINSSGSVTVGNLSADTVATLTATYTDDDVTKSGTITVRARNIPDPVVLTGLQISGAASVGGNSTALYTATAIFSDGSSQIVVPTWGEDSAATTISAFGLLSAGDVAASTNVTVSASHTVGGVTHSASKAVSVIAQNVPPTITSSGAASGVVGQPFQYLIAVQNGPATVTATGLPPGVSLSPATFTLEGTPTTVGAYQVSLTATTNAGSAHGAVVITISSDPSNFSYEFKSGSSIAVGGDNPMAAAPEDGVLFFDDFTGTRLNAQGQVVWSIVYENNNPDVEIRNAKRHPAGGWAVAGNFENSATFGPDTLVSSGRNDAFLMRIDDNGAVLWARRCGGTKTDYGRAIAIDGEGNCFLAGEFTTSATFGDTVTLNATGTRFDLFVAKYSATGEFQWVKQLGGAEYDTMESAVADASGNVYIAGTFEIQASVGGQTLTVQGNQTSQDSFIAKFGPSGILLWAKQFGEPSGQNSSETIRSLETDSGGNLFFGGIFEGPMTVDAQSLPFQGVTTGFAGKIGANGVVSWMRAIPATGSSKNTSVKHIAVMPGGGLVVAGDYRGKLTFAASVLTPQNENNGLEENIFIARFDPIGTPLWALAIANSGWKDFDYLGAGSDSKLIFSADMEATEVQLPGLPPIANPTGGTIFGVLGPIQMQTGMTFSRWLASHFSAQELGNPLVSGPNADIDGDGVGTLLEFSAGRHPRVSEPGSLTLSGRWTLGLPLI